MLTLEGMNGDDFNNLPPEQRKQFWNEFTVNYAKSLGSNMTTLNAKQGVYNPILGQEMTTSVSSSYRAPTPAQVEMYLKDPNRFAKQLREISNFYESSIMQYKRTVSHFAKILSFKYDLRLQDDYDNEDEDVVKAVINARNRCNSFLKNLNVPYHTKMVMDGAVRNGGGFYYLKSTEDFISLLEMPIDFCYITGKWDRGLTYAIDLTFFDTFIGLKNQMPEMYEYYKVFIKARDANLSNYKNLQYYPVPIEEGFVFTFDQSATAMIPPFSGVFRDATAIFTYKNLLMQKTALETWKVIAQKIPLDKNNVPILSGEQAQIFVDFAQLVMPSGTATFATPMEIHEVDFSGSASSQNNIVGRGEELFWRSVGVNGSLMDATDKSSATMKFSLINDELFSDSIYQQFSEFINLHLKLISRKYSFAVNFFGNPYLDLETFKVVKDGITSMNMPVSMAYAYLGYEPFQIVPSLKIELDLEIKKLSIPLISGYQQSGSGEVGADEKAIEDLTDAGLETRDSGANLDKKEG